MIRLTSDGSTTVFSETFQQYYHSLYGAKTESDRVYIELGLRNALEKFGEINILEVGFGTGLNAFLTAAEVEKKQISVYYEGIEAFPLEETILAEMEIPALYPNPSFDFQMLHSAPWNEKEQLSPFFSFRKIHQKIEEFSTKTKFHLVYFDAFAPEAQPELWTNDVFKKIADFLYPEGILTTYCSKSMIQRSLKSAGFRIEKHKGPPRKREVIRAIIQK